MTAWSAWRRLRSRAWRAARCCRSAIARCFFPPESRSRLRSSLRMENSTRILISLLPLLLCGCETLGYYAQAIGGQLYLMARAKPVAAVIADPATAPALKQRLELASSIRDYASTELKLPDNGSYRSYAELGRPFVVWNV